CAGTITTGSAATSVNDSFPNHSSISASASVKLKKTMIATVTTARAATSHPVHTGFSTAAGSCSGGGGVTSGGVASMICGSSGIGLGGEDKGMFLRSLEFTPVLTQSRKQEKLLTAEDAVLSRRARRKAPNRKGREGTSAKVFLALSAAFLCVLRG